ncbi:tetratricopeptide repeat protein [Rhizobium indicum]|uniref:tetratricopeptide repeat protein n=1 Tax=Rhizobium indicum TaxID=2583231 RepID=UPI0011070075|nr:tetratricopeptide repeat protein [Rhizobium indicum]QKK30510.1 tetratricopeptide repeat protein [Rhizobium indicum]
MIPRFATKRPNNYSLRIENQGKECTENSAATYALLAQLLISRNDVEAARAAATTARAIYQELDNQPAVLALDGQLGQILKRLGRFEEALVCVRHGFAVALRSLAYYQKSAFKSDEAQLLLALKRPQEALVAATEALQFVRENQDNLGELKVTGTIGHCYLLQENYSQAEEQAQAGLAIAQRMGEVGETAAFCMDLGKIAQLQKNFVVANSYFLRGLDPAEKAGDHALYTALYKALLDNAAFLHDWASLIKVVLVHLTNLDRIEPSDRVHFTRPFVHAIQTAVFWADRKATEEQLTTLAALTALVAKESGDVSNDFQFSVLVIELYLFWLRGTSELALPLAEMLDRTTENEFEFRSSMTGEPPS